MLIFSYFVLTQLNYCFISNFDQYEKTNKNDRIAPKTYCIKDRLGKSHTDHTAKMNFFLIIFVTCFVVASIKAHTVDVFGDVDGKKLIGHKMIFERAEKHGTIVRTVKFPEVMIEITIICMKNWFFEQKFY